MMMMTPVSLVLDRVFDGVGRIKKATGTTSRRVYDRISDMCTALHSGEAPRLDILRALRDGEVTLLQVYDAYRRNALHTLPLGLTGQLLSTALDDWFETIQIPIDYSMEHVRSLKTSRGYFTKARPKARVIDLPELLEELRDTLGAEYPRSFNLARAGAMAFVRAKLKRNHPLWLAIAAVELRKVEKKPPRAKLSPEQALALFPDRENNWLDRVAWVMLTTGMHQKEYWGAWSNEGTHISVHGTKRSGRNRRIPLVLPPAPPPWKHRRNFEDAFRERTTAFTPYDLRRTYSHWMELAMIPRTRRRLYMGHSAKDVTDLYEEHEVTEFLAGDAEKLRAFLKLDPPSTPLRLHQGGAA